MIEIPKWMKYEAQNIINETKNFNMFSTENFQC